MQNLGAKWRNGAQAIMRVPGCFWCESEEMWLSVELTFIDWEGKDEMHILRIKEVKLTHDN